MNNTLKGFFTVAAASLPFLTGLFFFSGNSYYEARLLYWGVDPSMFPESVVEKVYEGSKVIAYQVPRSIFLAMVICILSLVVITHFYRFSSWAERWTNPVFEGFAKWLFGRYRTGKKLNKPSEFERTSFIVFASFWLLLVLAIMFSVIAAFSNSASETLAHEIQDCAKKDYDSFLDGNKTGVCKKDLKRRKTLFIMKDGTEISGFVIECSVSLCLVYTGKRVREVIQLSEIKRNIMTDV